MSIWDERHAAPIVTSDSVDPIHVEGRQRHVIRPGATESFALDCLIEPKSSDVLVVPLHGALDRSKYTLPRFEWMGTLQQRTESLLFLCDTGLKAHEDLRISWYTGSSTDDLTVRYATLIAAMAKKIGATKIVLLGFSGGGFAALSLATLLPEAVALAFSPQTSIGRYYPVFSQAYADALFKDCESFGAVEKKYGTRTNLLERYASPETAANFVYVQNTGDAHHMQNHYSPFRELTEGRMGARFITANESSTHSVPSKERVLEILDKSLADL